MVWIYSYEYLAYSLKKREEVQKQKEKFRLSKWLEFVAVEVKHLEFWDESTDIHKDLTFLGVE